MSICLKLKEDYLKEIKAIEDSCKENSKKLKLEDKRDEAILENIKLNVIDIFSKMFNISFSKVYKNGIDKNIVAENLKEEYMKFFEKIMALGLLREIKIRNII